MWSFLPPQSPGLNIPLHWLQEHAYSLSDILMIPVSDTTEIIQEQILPVTRHKILSGDTLKEGTTQSSLSFMVFSKRIVYIGLIDPAEFQYGVFWAMSVPSLGYWQFRLNLIKKIQKVIWMGSSVKYPPESMIDIAWWWDTRILHEHVKPAYAWVRGLVSYFGWMSGIDAKDEKHFYKLILVLSNVGENFKQLIIVIWKAFFT